MNTARRIAACLVCLLAFALNGASQRVFLSPTGTDGLPFSIRLDRAWEKGVDDLRLGFKELAGARNLRLGSKVISVPSVDFHVDHKMLLSILSADNINGKEMAIKLYSSANTRQHRIRSFTNEGITGYPIVPPDSGLQSHNKKYWQERPYRIEVYLVKGKKTAVLYFSMDSDKRIPLALKAAKGFRFK